MIGFGKFGAVAALAKTYVPGVVTLIEVTPLMFVTEDVIRGYGRLRFAPLP